MLERLIIGICDDEQKSIEITKECCERVSKELGIPFIYQIFMSGEEVLNCDRMIDILLLDIELNGMNGIETMHIIEDMDVIGNIIFVSGYPNYLHEAFGIKTKGFVCKPIEFDNIKMEFERTITYIKKGINKQIVEVNVNNRIIPIDLENIVYVQGKGRYVTIVTDTQSYLVTENIKVWEQKLSDSMIQRIHKSYLMNFKYVSEITGTEIVLKDNTKPELFMRY